MSGDIEDLRRNWEAFGATDPLWAVLTDPGLEGRKWDPDAFLASGEREISTVMDRLGDLELEPDFTGEALDFGCGAGRLTQPLAERFTVAHGVDIAEPMIRAARGLNRQGDAAVFHHNTAVDLRLFDDGAFSFVYSSIVLQHMAPALAIGYLKEFLRVLAPEGLLVFQIPDRRIPPGAKDRAWGMLVRARRGLALATRIRERRLRLHRAPPGPIMEMHAVPEEEIRHFFASGGEGAIRDVALTNSADVDFNGDLRFLPAEPAEGWVSKQYTILRL